MTTIAPPPIWTNQAPYLIALDALERFQWSVFPLDEEKKPPKTGGAHADGQPKRLAWKCLQEQRISPKELRHWQRAYQPAAWAVITGAISNIVLLDFDGEVGQQTREQLGLLHPHVRTGSGGHHVYFRHPGWKVPTLNCKTAAALGERWPGLDIRADGGYAAFCGRNTHGPYRWLRHPEPDDLELLPEALRRYLGLLEPPDARMTEEAQLAEDNARSPGVSAQILLARALHLLQQEGKGRNNTGFWLACQLRDNGYTLDVTRNVLRTYVEQVPRENTKGVREPYTLEEAFASVTSAFREAPRSPWVPTSTAASGKGGNGSDAPPTTATCEDPQGLPDIIVNGEQLRELVDQSIGAIMRQEGSSPGLFIQSARLVRIGRSELGRPLLILMGPAEVKEVLTHSANFFRVRKATGGEYERIAVSPPNEVAEQILARQSQAPYLPFPPLAAIIETPVIRPDGSILDQPGYDQKTQLYYMPHGGMETCQVSRKPTKQERDDALALLWSTIGEFPYVSDADKANALGLLLTPIVRPAIKRHVALALIDAPKQGTGKGLLSDVVSIIATGKSAAILTMSDNDDEVQKVITSLLIEGASIITIDNIAGRLQSRHLDAALTSDMWRARILGTSKTTLVPQRATWLATGNNIKLGGDLARRCYRIRLDAKISRPYMRKGFTHSDLATWVAEHRSELVGALLTLARAWYAAGKPPDKHLPALGTFSGWAKIVGGILAYAGVEGFLSNLEQLYDEADEDGIQWEAFFQTWHQLLGEDWLPLGTILHEIMAADEAENVAGSVEEKREINLSEHLPSTLQMALKEKPRSFPIRLGKALDRLVDTCFGVENLRLEKKRDAHSKTNLWRIFAGSAGSVSPPTRVENLERKKSCVQENTGRNDGNNSPHSPQNQMVQKSVIGLGSDVSTISTPVPASLECENTTQLPATTSEREEFYI